MQFCQTTRIMFDRLQEPSEGYFSVGPRASPIVTCRGFETLLFIQGVYCGEQPKQPALGANSFHQCAFALTLILSGTANIP